MLLLYTPQTNRVALHVAKLEPELLRRARVLVTARRGGSLPAQAREFTLLLLDDFLERLHDILELLRPPLVLPAGVLAVSGRLRDASALGEVLEEPVDAALEPVCARGRLLSLEAE